MVVLVVRVVLVIRGVWVPLVVGRCRCLVLVEGSLLLV